MTIIVTFVRTQLSDLRKEAEHLEHIAAMLRKADDRIVANAAPKARRRKS